MFLMLLCLQPTNILKQCFFFVGIELQGFGFHIFYDHRAQVHMCIGYSYLKIH